MTTSGAQLSFRLGGRGSTRPASSLDREPDERLEPEPFVLTSALRRHRRRRDVEAKIRYCLNFFPELRERRFGVGVTRQAQGLASLDDFAIWLNPHRLTLHTIAHELTHLLQADGRVPGGERSCDLFALARHPSLNDSRPNYLDIPDDLFDERGYYTRTGWPTVLYESARRAIDERASGRRTYIRWFEVHVTALSAAGTVAGRSPTPRSTRTP